MQNMAQKPHPSFFSTMTFASRIKWEQVTAFRILFGNDVNIQPRSRSKLYTPDSKVLSLPLAGKTVIFFPLDSATYSFLFLPKLPWHYCWKLWIVYKIQRERSIRSPLSREYYYFSLLDTALDFQLIDCSGLSFHQSWPPILTIFKSFPWTLEQSFINLNFSLIIVFSRCGLGLQEVLSAWSAEISPTELCSWNMWESQHCNGWAGMSPFQATSGFRILHSPGLLPLKITGNQSNLFKQHRELPGWRDIGI